MFGRRRVRSWAKNNLIFGLELKIHSSSTIRAEFYEKQYITYYEPQNSNNKMETFVSTTISSVLMSVILVHHHTAACGAMETCIHNVDFSEISRGGELYSEEQLSRYCTLTRIMLDCLSDQCPDADDDDIIAVRNAIHNTGRLRTIICSSAARDILSGHYTCFAETSLERANCKKGLTTTEQKDNNAVLRTKEELCQDIGVYVRCVHETVQRSCGKEVARWYARVERVSAVGQSIDALHCSVPEFMLSSSAAYLYSSVLNLFQLLFIILC